MKKIIILAASLIAAFNVFGQTATEVIANCKKMSVPGISITVDGDEDIAIKTLKNMLKDEKLKAKTSDDFLETPAVNFTKVSPNLMYVYAKAEENKDNTTNVTVFMATGLEAGTFISSATNPDAVSNMKAFLQDEYAKRQNAEALRIAIKEKQEDIKDIQGDIKSEEKKIKNLNKRLAQGNTDLTTAEAQTASARTGLAGIQNNTNVSKETIKAQEKALKKQEKAGKSIKKNISKNKEELQESKSKLLELQNKLAVANDQLRALQAKQR